MAGIPKGDTRNARINTMIPPVVCPAISATMPSRDRPILATLHSAAPTQNINVMTAAKIVSMTTKGAASIFNMIRMTIPPLKVADLPVYANYNSVKMGTQGCRGHTDLVRAVMDVLSTDENGLYVKMVPCIIEMIICGAKVIYTVTG